MDKKETVWAYLSGYFDGDGCVNITESGGRHRLQVVMTKKDEGFLGRLKNATGMGIVNSGSWRMVTQEAEDFLRKIHPYSIAKKPEIEVALRFRETIGRTGNFGRKGLTKSIKEQRDELMYELQGLKK